MSKRKGKVFIGFSNIANVGLSLKLGFEEIGYKADFYSKEKVLHKYDYSDSSDLKFYRVIWSKFKIVRYLQSLWLFLKLLIRYKYFIFLQGQDGYLFSNSKDIIVLKFFKKIVSVVLTGCDVRVPRLVEKYKWNPCRDCPETYRKSGSCEFPNKYQKLDAINQNFNIIFSPDECGGYFSKKYITYYFPVKDINRSIIVTNSSDEKKTIRIVHAPSNEDYKGSKYIYDAIKNLRNKYDFEFIKLQNLSKDELIEEILKCDLVIDQMLVGSYGILTVETMLLKKPVVCYIRDDIWNKIGKDCPIFNANPDNLGQVLENILQNPAQLINRGEESRNYALQYHSPKILAEKMMKVFQEER